MTNQRNNFEQAVEGAGFEDKGEVAPHNAAHDFSPKNASVIASQIPINQMVSIVQ